MLSNVPPIAEAERADHLHERAGEYPELRNPAGAMIGNPLPGHIRSRVVRPA
jgi:hypothetical protein